MDLRPPSKKARRSAPTPRAKPARPSVPWANGALVTPAPPDDAPILEVDEEDEENEAATAELGAYQQVCEKSSAPLSAYAVRAAVKTELSHQSGSISLFFSHLTKVKTMLKLFWPLLTLNSRILGSI